MKKNFLRWPKKPDKKTGALLNILRRMESVVVAYSGGVDSSLLVAAAQHALGRRALAVTALSPTFPGGDLRDACRQARRHGWPHLLIATRELENEKFARNPADRCYHCKTELFTRLLRIAQGKQIRPRSGATGTNAPAERGGYSCSHGAQSPCKIEIPMRKFRWVADGSNTDDLGDYRPGARAKAALGIRSPLQEAGFAKADVRKLARRIGLMTADKPVSACLASRIPYGTRITRASLVAIAKAEDLLRKLGFGQVRVRLHGDIARIELDPAELGRAVSAVRRRRIVRALKQCGFRYIALDLEGYRTGSMNYRLLENARVFQ